MGCPTADKFGWPDFPFKFVKYAQYSPHLNEKSYSANLALATNAILGQPPSTAGRNRFRRSYRESLRSRGTRHVSPKKLCT